METEQTTIADQIQVQKPKKKPQGWINLLKFILPFIFVLALFQFIGMLIAGVDVMHGQTKEQTPLQQFIISVFSLIGTAGIVALFYKYVDQKQLLSIGFTKGSILKDIVWGIALGMVLITGGFLILTTTGQISISTVQFNARDFIFSFLLFVCVAISEELFSRGYFLTNLMASMNKYLALGISALLFCLLHIANSNVTFLSMTNIFLAGILLGLPFIYTRQLWFPIALHFSWNFFQGPVFGYSVSGTKTSAIFITKYSEANIWNGGEFGFEGSIVSTFFLVAAIAIVYFLFRKRTAVEIEE